MTNEADVARVEQRAKCEGHGHSPWAGLPHASATPTRKRCRMQQQ